jgi:hypothetical protein
MPILNQQIQPRKIRIVKLENKVRIVSKDKTHHGKSREKLKIIWPVSIVAARVALAR